MRPIRKRAQIAVTLRYIAKTPVKFPKLPPITRDTPNLLQVLDKHRRMRLAKETAW